MVSSRNAVARARSRVTPSLGVAFGAFVGIGLSDGALGTAWPAIRHSLSTPLSDLGLIQLAGTAGFFTSSTFSGRLTSHLGRARALAAAAGVGAAGLGLYAGAPAFSVLLLAALVAGLAGGMVESGMQSHVALSAGPRAMNLLHGCYGIGATLGPLLVSALLLEKASWRIAYLVLVGIDVLILLGAVRRRTAFDTTSPPRRAPQASSRAAAGEEAPLSRLALVTALALFFVYCGVEVGTGQWAFTLLTSGRHLGTGLAGGLVAGYWAALTVVRLAVAALGGRVDPDRVLIVSAVGSVAGELLYWWDATTAVGAVGLLVTGASLAPAFPLMMSRTPRWAKGSRVSSVIGWQSAAAGIGIAALSGLASLLIANFGLGALCPYLAALSVGYLVLQLAALGAQDRRSEAAGAGVATGGQPA